MRQRVYDKWLFFIFKGVFGLLLRGLSLLYAALFFIFKGVLGLLLLRVALALCSPVLHIQRCFWVALAWIALALCSPVLHIQRCFWVALAWIALALCSPVLHIQKCFLAAHVWGLPRFYAAPSTLDDAIGYRCSMLIMANRQTSRDVCTANVRRHQSAYHAFLVFTLVRGSL